VVPRAIVLGRARDFQRVLLSRHGVLTDEHGAMSTFSDRRLLRGQRESGRA
jgi:hypothetical protein